MASPQPRCCTLSNATPTAVHATQYARIVERKAVLRNLIGAAGRIAGRSPSYTVRQLFDMQQGVRKGPWSALMKSAVEKLTVDDMIAIAAYTASREP